MEDDSIRNLILAFGLAGAFLGVWLASIRSMDFAKQVDAQTKQMRAQTDQVTLFAKQVDAQGYQISLLAEQVKTQTRQTELQTQQVRSETLSRCIQQTGHESSSAVRTAGIIGLETLARDNQNNAEFLQHVGDILQGFIDERTPPRWPSSILPKFQQTKELPPSYNLQDLIQAANLNEKEATQLEKWDAHWQKHKAEAAQAIHTFARIVAIKPTTLRRLDLSFRYLPQFYPSKREGGKSSLHGAALSRSFLPYALLWHTNLRSAHFVRLHLSKANLKVADLRKTVFCETKLKDANFENANLAGAVYYENEDEYLKDVGNDPPKLGKPVTKEWLKEQGVENWNKAQGIPDR